MPCSRTPCPRQHPCDRKCSEDCGDCRFPMYKVRLPCGHVAASVPCHLYDDLSKVACSVKVTKNLPRCEHSAVMPCNRDPSKWPCKEVCGGVMGCCTKTCKSRCGDCQRLSTPPDVIETVPRVIARSSHRAHPCERTLYCQHLCGLDCHPKDNGCNPSCKKECRQRCSHHSCDKPCSSPCAPCMQECEWRCPHQECPVACGSICARLPCDEPCGNLLECNHPCPSVCGEKCQNQICVLCLAPDSEKRKDVVDLVMQRTLAEIDLSSTDVSERLITLDCRHTFTVETLDGHCSMQDYYEVDPMGTYLALKAPPVDYQLPPVCPTCRSTITAQRYGRVAKRAILDVLEQNVTATMSRALEQLNPELQRITTALTTLESDAKKITADPDGISDPSTNREEHAKGKITEPLPVSRLDRSAMHSVHGFSTNESQGWNALVGDLLKLYIQAHAIATKRGAHVQAYEAAVTTLFRLELRAIMENPDANGDLTGPEPRAMEAARKDVGQPPHKADSKFQVEAYHRTLELRFMLAQLAQCRLEGLQSTLTDDQVIKHRSLWESFIDFIYQSCEADAKKALSMAEMSSASRQVAHCSVYVIRSRFERERFQDITAEKKLPSISQPQGRTAREQLTNIVASQRRTINLELARMQNAYMGSRPTRTTQDLRAEQAWFADNCHRKVDKYLKELDKLAEFIRKGGTYEALSVQEIEDIVKAFDFGYTGHFYRCPNGHPYVIGECGGAMEQGRCNECGEAIGGGSHTLLNTNSTAAEFEGVLHRNGVPRGFY